MQTSKKSKQKCILMKMNEDVRRKCYSNFVKKINVIKNTHNFVHYSSTDEDPSLRIESFAMINLRGVSTKLYYLTFTMHSCKELADVNLL